MSVPREPPSRIVVVGAGPLGLLAAIGLKRASPTSELVVAGEMPGVSSFADWSRTAMPFTSSLHERLGIAESEIVQKAGGSYRLLTRFMGWDELGSNGVFCYGDGLPAEVKIAFARDCGSGNSGPASLVRFPYPAERLCAAGRFASPPPDRVTPLSHIPYAIRWDPHAYHQLLVAKARDVGVCFAPGPITATDWGKAGSLDAIKIEKAGRLKADLFVDCSGPDAVLLSAHPDFAAIDWSATLPTRMIYIARPNQPVIALEDRIALLDLGWQTQVAGRQGLCTVIGVGEGIPPQPVLSALGAPLEAGVDLSPGRATQPWLGNVIALGDAGARFEPLGPWHADLAHRQLDLLLELLPGRIIEPLEREEYNRRAGLMIDNMHDILALHYTSARARKVFGDRPPHANVTNLIDQFTRRGRTPFREEFPLSSQEQFSLLTALGFAPGVPLSAASIDPRHEEKAIAEFDATVAKALAFAPPYEKWLASVTRAYPVRGG